MNVRRDRWRGLEVNSEEGFSLNCESRPDPATCPETSAVAVTDGENIFHSSEFLHRKQNLYPLTIEILPMIQLTSRMRLAKVVALEIRT